MNFPESIDLLIFHYDPYSVWLNVLEKYGDEMLSRESVKLLHEMNVSKDQLDDILRCLNRYNINRDIQERKCVMEKLFSQVKPTDTHLICFLLLLTEGPQWKIHREGVFDFLLHEPLFTWCFGNKSPFSSQSLEEETLFLENFERYLNLHAENIPVDCLICYINIEHWEIAEKILQDVKGEDFDSEQFEEVLPYCLAHLWIKKGFVPGMESFLKNLVEKYRKFDLVPEHFISLLMQRLNLPEGKNIEIFPEHKDISEQGIPESFPKDLILIIFDYNPFVAWKDILLRHNLERLVKEAKKYLASLLTPTEMKIFEQVLGTEELHEYFNFRITLLCHPDSMDLLRMFLMLLVFLSRNNNDNQHIHMLLDSLQYFSPHDSHTDEFYRNVGDLLNLFKIIPKSEFLSRIVEAADWKTALKILHRDQMAELPKREIYMRKDYLFDALVSVWIREGGSSGMKEFLDVLQGFYRVYGYPENEKYEAIQEIRKQLHNGAIPQ